MAQKVVVSLVDDLDGGRADETVQFALDGKAYEIDLSSANADKLRDALGEFVTAARRAGRERRGGAGRSAAASASARLGVDREQNQAIRDWARANGYEVSDRGRIPAEVLEAYNQKQ
jgi:hypothetical protein